MKQVFSVSQINKYAKEYLENDSLLAGLFIDGEIANLILHKSGHMYFTLKDEKASIKSVLWRSNVQIIPKNGDKIIAFGKISLYERDGSFQFYAEFIEVQGEGTMQLAFKLLCEKLQKEGLFDNKRPIPAYPKCIAIITSPTGAALQDMIKTIRAKNTAVKITLAPALVQGELAPNSLCNALKSVIKWGLADTIIIGRGGGYSEDLSAFNNESLAREIANSPIPIISAVGHETDFTIADFAADFRAATPTAAAEMAVYDLQEARDILNNTIQDLKDTIRYTLDTHKNILDNLTNEILKTATRRKDKEKQSLEHQKALLETVSPYAVFKRGYAIVLDENDKKIKELRQDMTVYLQMANTKAKAVIKEVQYDI